MTQISHFISEVVLIVQVVTGDGDESAATFRGGGFADYASVSLHCLRIYLATSYRMTINLLKEMPQITGEIGLSAVDLPSPSTLCKAFDRIDMSVCRVLLRQSAQLHDLSKHAAITNNPVIIKNLTSVSIGLAPADPGYVDSSYRMDRPCRHRAFPA